MLTTRNPRSPCRRISLARQLTAALLSTCVLAACGDAPADQTDGDTPAAATTPRVVEVSAGDFFYTMPDTLTSGATTFRLATNGQELHHMTLVQLHDGHTLEELLTAMHGGPPPMWAQFLGGPNAPTPMAGNTSVTLDLAPGSYAALCLIPSPDGVEHVAKGMSKAFTVVATDAPAMMPVATDTMTLTDYDFVLGRPLTAGAHTLQLVNTAQQPHEVFVAKLAPGATPGQLVAWIMKPEGPPPGEAMGGITAMLPGVVNLLELNLTPGEYALICFLPDAKDGQPHLAHGMMKQMSVQ